MDSTPLPILPAIWVGRPASFRMWWIRAVVVDFPFEPVTVTTFGGVSISAQVGSAADWKKRPMSLSTGIPTSTARAMTGCGVG